MISNDSLDSIAEAFLAREPERKPKGPKRKSWRPRAGPIGYEILRHRSVIGRPSDVLIKLLYGERGSTKSNILLNDLVVHCHSDLLKPEPGKVHISPLAVICSIIRSAATEGGAWEKLHSLVLPEWYDGLGLEFTEPKQDDQKNRFCFISTMYGTWARVVLKSIPHGEKIKARIKGIEPSYFMFEEIADTESPDYLFQPLQQLRRPTGSRKIYAASCNPPDSGEEHWTWKNFVIQPCKAAGNEEPEIPDGGGRLKGMDEQFAVYHVPLSENVFWSAEEKAAYQNTIMVEARYDSSAADRLLHGKWTARPTGEGLFKEYYIPEIHVRPRPSEIKEGVAKIGDGLLPRAGFPIVISYDLGQVWSTANFLQLIPTRTKPIWICFDEVDHLNERILYKKYAWEIIERMRYWCRKIKLPNGESYPFQFMHIADESAINQWRPGGEGSYDAWDFEREFNKVYAEFGGKSMRMLGCPKGAGSVASRIRWLQSKLYQEEFFVSARCTNLISMLMFLESDKNDAEKPRRSKWLHKFDGVTYGPWRNELFPGAIMPEQQRVPTITAIGT